MPYTCLTPHPSAAGIFEISPGDNYDYQLAPHVSAAGVGEEGAEQAAAARKELEPKLEAIGAVGFTAVYGAGVEGKGPAERLSCCIRTLSSVIPL